MRYRFIDKQKKAWPVTLMCGVLGVSRSGYYDWTARGRGRRVRSNNELDRRISQTFAEHRQRYGAPRITAALHDEGIECSENRIARRMRALGLQAIQAKKFKSTTDSKHLKPVAPDLIKQDFSAAAPNQKWTSDISYVWTDEGWLYLAVVMDLYSRAIVGWSMNQRMTQQLVCDALTMALFRRRFQLLDLRRALGHRRRYQEGWHHEGCHQEGRRERGQEQDSETGGDRAGNPAAETNHARHAPPDNRR